MFLYPLKNEKILVQILVFIILWVVGLYLSLNLFGGYLIDNFGTTDLKSLLYQYKNDEHFQKTIMYGNAIQQFLNFLLPVLLFCIWSSNRPFQYIGFYRPDNTNFKVIISIALTILMLIGIPRISELMQQINLGEASDSLQEVRKSMEGIYFEDTSDMGLIRNLFLLAVIPAVCEELFFRGIFQRLLFSVTNKAWISILLTGIFFSFLHDSIVNFVPIVIAAIVLGYIYFFTKNIWYSILTHFLFNAIQVVMNFFIRRDPTYSEQIEQSKEVSMLQISSYTLLFAVSMIVCYLILRKYYNSYKQGKAVISDAEWKLGS